MNVEGCKSNNKNLNIDELIYNNINNSISCFLCWSLENLSKGWLQRLV